MLHGVRAQFAATVAALDGDARVSWRQPRTLCAPDVQTAGGTLAQEGADAATAADVHCAGAQPQVVARRAQLRAELAWAEAALASRRAQLRDARQ